MISTKKFRTLALSLPETTEMPHFEKTSFRVDKKIFATLDIKTNLACIKLSEVDQGVFRHLIKPLCMLFPTNGENRAGLIST